MVWNHTHTIATVFLCLLRVCGDFIKHDYHEEWEPSVQIYITYVYIKYIHSIHNTYIGESIYMKKVCYLLSCVWLWDTMDSGSSAHVILQARIPEWVIISFWSRLPGDLPDPGIKLWSPALQADSLLSEPPRKPMWIYMHPYICMHPVYMCMYYICMKSKNGIQGWYWRLHCQVEHMEIP